MRINDYLEMMKCKKCGAGIYIPVVWNSKKWKRPTYGTCEHVNSELRKEEAKKTNER